MTVKELIKELQAVKKDIMIEILSEIEKMTNVEQLRIIGSRAYQRIKELKIKEANYINWYVGQEVRLKLKYQNRKPYSKIGTVKKVNSVKLKVNFDNIVWNVSKVMLDVVK